MASFSFHFTIADYVPPWVENRLPVPTQTAVDVDSSVSFDLLDDYSGVDLSTVMVLIGGRTAYDGGSFAPQFGGTVVPVIMDGYDGYRFTIMPDAPFALSSAVDVSVTGRDFSGNPMPPPDPLQPDNDGYWTFYTESTVMTVVSGLYEITLDVAFSGPMTVDGALENPGCYQFDNGMYARLVDVLSPSSVRLWVELYQGSGSFSMMLDPAITDSYGGSISGSFEVDAPFQSDATMSASNGLIRTWAGRGSAFPRQGSRLAWMDSQRVYLAGSKGIDVFRRNTAGTVVRWAQVLDAYGVDAMFVANFDGDYIFDDIAAPILEDQVPAPGSSDAKTTTDITFTVSDATTAVEIVATAAYVNGVLAFAGGAGGWMNGWTGSIVVRHNSIILTLYPPLAYTPGTSVTVRVVSADLLGNALDESYVFQISPQPLTAGEFGLGLFGSGSFGGA
jgi:hypothetical protein